MANFEVIIIGAGAAGLMAANVLQEHDVKVCILEARDRIGGRIHDIDTEKMGHLHLGASWLHRKGENHILQPLLDQHHVTYLKEDALESSEKMEIYTEHGKLSGKDKKLFMEILIRLPKDIRIIGQQQPTLSVADVVTLIGKKHHYSQSLIQALITRSTEHCSLNADVMPASAFDGWEPNGLFVKDGFGKLMHQLSNQINIELNTIVKCIDQTDHNVLIDTNKKRFSCHRVISTLPTGVLQSGQVKFVPPLPANKKIALSQLDSGNHEKIFLKFPSVFWDEDTEVFQLATPSSRGVCTQWYNPLLKAENQKILYTNISGPDIAYANKSDRALQDICMTQLRQIFGDHIPDPESIYVTRWSLDPFTLGGPYAHPTMAGEMAHLSTIGQPFDHIHFAGVDTSESETETVEAALLSGIRAANQILSAI